MNSSVPEVHVEKIEILSNIEKYNQYIILKKILEPISFENVVY